MTLQDDFCITIPLSGGEKDIGPNGQSGGALSQDFLRALQDEYATRFLEFMNIEPNQKNKTALLQRKPLTACEINPGWDGSGWLADFVIIYPNKNKSKTFEQHRETQTRKRTMEL